MCEHLSLTPKALSFSTLAFLAPANLSVVCVFNFLVGLAVVEALLLLLVVCFFNFLVGLAVVEALLRLLANEKGESGARRRAGEINQTQLRVVGGEWRDI
jgi:hypothetical protein